MKEGSLEAPTRHKIDWKDPDFLDPQKIDEELRRVFDICHGCRRCFNLCESFPRLFDLVDESESGELDSVASADFAPVIEACTLCDMCFLTKCPYVPPHEFDLDFPHLMLRARMAEVKAGKGENVTARQLAEMDRNGRLAAAVAPIANWASGKSNGAARAVMQGTLGIDARAELPKFHTKTFIMADRGDPIRPNAAAPAFGKRKAALFATCFVNYNKPATGLAARAVMNHIGVATKAAYPGCCGMPFLEQADLARVAEQARKVSAALRPLIDDGYEIVTLTASCGLMFKFEWPLIVPGDENVKALSAATRDIDEIIVDIAKKEGLPPIPGRIEGGVSVHLACHARAQNMGAKAAEMLRLIPEIEIDIIERCAGHGGTFGVLQPTADLARKVGTPVFRQLTKQARAHVVSDCPLAGKHIVQGAAELAAKAGETLPARHADHPVELLAKAYGLME
ncbi:MAG: glycerol-3-phosphate dehydrogenase [Alphaproteobacteria bacterium]|nr:glycerol-3-phosphate dehydrogenase [Alphaproteobacteria bacterium]